MYSVRRTVVFQLKLHFLTKVCYKVYLCENCQRQSCNAFVGLTIRAKMIGGDVFFCVKIWRILTHHPVAKGKFSVYFRS